MNNEKEIYYSHIEDNWFGCDKSIEVAAESCLGDMTAEQAEETEVLTLYSGEEVLQKFDFFLSVDWLIEDMQNRAYDMCGEGAKDYLDDVTEEQKKQLNDLINKWADDNGIAPNFFMIENIREIKVNKSEVLGDE